MKYISFAGSSYEVGICSAESALGSRLQYLELLKEEKAWWVEEHACHCWEYCGSYQCLHGFSFIMHSMSLRFFPNHSLQAFPLFAEMDLSGETWSFFCLWGSWRELLLRVFLWQTTWPRGSTELLISPRVILRVFSVVPCCFLTSVTSQVALVKMNSSLWDTSRWILS